MQSRGTVYIIDDDMIIRKSIGLTLKNAGFSPHPFANGADFLDALGYLESGCVLLDMHMPGITGLDVQDRLLEQGSEMPILIMTGAGNIPMAVHTIKRGAFDFIEKPIDEGLLVRLLAEAFDQLERSRAKTKALEKARRLMSLLSARELEVLKLLSAGNPNKKIAFNLDLSVRTVEMHRANIMHKLGIHSIAEALQITTDANLPQSPEGPALPRKAA